MAKTPSAVEQKELGWTAGYDVNEFSYCCGGREVGGLSMGQQNVWYQSYWGKKEWAKNPNLFPTPKEAWEGMLKRIREGYEHYPLMFNLTQELKELREVLNKEPDATMVHTWRNPNTANMIEMWILTNGSDEEYHGDDDDNDY